MTTSIDGFSLHEVVLSHPIFEYSESIVDGGMKGSAKLVRPTHSTAPQRYFPSTLSVINIRITIIQDGAPGDGVVFKNDDALLFVVIMPSIVTVKLTFPNNSVYRIVYNNNNKELHIVRLLKLECVVRQ